MCSKGIKNRARISGSITNCNLKECEEILLSHWSYKRKLQKKSTTIKQCSFLFHNFIYFSFGRAGSSLLGGVSLVAMLGFSVQWLLSCGARALGHAGSVDVALGLNSHGSWAIEHNLKNCGIRAQLPSSIWVFPGPGVKPMSPALQVGSLRLSHLGSPTLCLYQIRQTHNI